MAREPSDRRGERGRPEIWASGGQRPPFDLRALGRAGLHLSRTAVAGLTAGAARGLRRAAVNVKAGRGRIPAGKLGRAERFVPSHLRVAAWIANLAATFAHASATADRDIPRGNALVAEIAPHLWDQGAAPAPAPALPERARPVAKPEAMPNEVAPVVLPEPTDPAAAEDPLAAIRGEIGGSPLPRAEARPAPVPGPQAPPAPRGPVAEGVVQVAGWLTGWAATGLALPYGLGRALWLWAGGRDLKTIGRED
ncbi:hypothetical protein [Tabrizicola flagellatus]|uniref:hypothetical protein n=1 Tax=Tabrizicola flagellatus TaxID=2593021 RepID=UPI0011F3627C|nr:hypothetical protein [Tabrizicola flagellatus]